MCSELGVTQDKILALDDFGRSPLYDEKEKVALEYAEAMTYSDRDVNDELFSRLKNHFAEDEIIELTSTIAWENSSSKFNRALRIPSQNLWKEGKRAEENPA